MSTPLVISPLDPPSGDIPAWDFGLNSASPATMESFDHIGDKNDLDINALDFLYLPPSLPTLPALSTDLASNYSIRSYPTLSQAQTAEKQANSEKPASKVEEKDAPVDDSAYEEDYIQRLENLEKIFDKIVKDTDKHLAGYKDLWMHVKNAYHFKEELMGFLKEVISSDTCDHISDNIDNIYDPLKVFKPLGAAALNAVKYVALQQARKELDHIQKGIQKQSKHYKLKNIQRRLERLSNRIKEEQQEAINDSTEQGAKVIGNHFIAAQLAKYAGLSQNKVLKGCKIAADVGKEIKDIRKIWQGYKYQGEWQYHLAPRLRINEGLDLTAKEKIKNELEAFLLSLNNAQTIEDVKKILEDIRIDLDVPSDIEEWKEWLQHDRMQDYLLRSYQYRKGIVYFANQDDIQALLIKRQQFTSKILIFNQEKIELFAAQSVDLSFEEIQRWLAQEHIHLKEIEGAPQTKDEWIQRIQQEDFIVVLAKQRAAYQETVARLAEQGLRAGLLKKISLERKLLTFRGIESILNIALACIRIAFYLPGLGGDLEKYLINLLVDKLPIPGLGLVTILCCDRDLTLDNLFMMAIHHCVGYYYKPNEYSLEGYKINAKMQYSRLMAQLYLCVNLLKRMLLWIRIRIVENFILRRQNRSIETDSQYQDLKQRLNQYNLEYRAKMMQWEAQIEKLKLADLQLLLQPNPVKIIASNGEEEDFEPLKNLVAALDSSDFDCFPQDILDTFKEHAGLDLTEENKSKTEASLKSLFLKAELSLSKSYLANRIAFLKSGQLA
ncbi:hypothetical protein [Candidatus Protochlamydia phocaeensis]|uniref:hypothetical protein n=1 Tax=Candidatus Protochlamydia phocaeensis TaxID=1414722 RepID=UPI0008388AE6|nr:hypothetical protein [Candidatus Protochlamydia phocaeensis]